MYTIETTTNAYNGNIPEGAWNIESIHRTASAAIKKHILLYKELNDPRGAMSCCSGHVRSNVTLDEIRQWRDKEFERIATIKNEETRMNREFTLSRDLWRVFSL